MEGTLDFSNAAPENKGRERVTDQVRIRIIVKLGLGLSYTKIGLHTNHQVNFSKGSRLSRKLRISI